MLENISWSQFILFTGAALAVYYVLLVVVFGKKAGKGNSSAGQLPVLSTRKRVWQPLDNPEPAAEPLPVEQPTVQTKQVISAEDELFDLLEQLADEIQDKVSQANRNDWHALRPQLQQLVASYPALHGEPYRKAIITHTEKCVKDYLDMELPADTLTAVWQQD
ncbi:LemA family protein [Chitinophaga sp. 180180018-2]|nr:LemA family protein [Chitinophaga sp. 212800010-3]